MSFYHNPRIVTDGLLVMVDAVNPKSYTSGSTVIQNLAGSGDFTGYNGVGLSGSAATQRIVFDGVNDFTLRASTPTSLQGDPSFTVFGACYRTGTISAEGCWGFGTGTTLDGFASYQGGTPNDISIDLWGNTTLTTTKNYPLNEWVLVHWVKAAGACNTTNTAMWINDIKYTGGDLFVSRGGVSTPTIGSQGMSLGRIGYAVNAYYAPVDLGFITFYDRVLNDAEVIQNYIAMRGRYGL